MSDTENDGQNAGLENERKKGQLKDRRGRCTRSFRIIHILLLPMN